MKPYYEVGKVKAEVPLEPIPKEVRALYLRPGELLSIQDRFPVVYQPLGTIEWHGRHNPIGVDSIKAEQLCLKAAEQTGGVVMPTIHFAVDAYWDTGYGIGYGMDATVGYQLPGSFYQMETGLFKQVLINACQNYLNRGFQLVVLVSGHNPPIQHNTIDEVCYAFKTLEGREPVCFSMDYTLIEPGHPYRASDHAAGIETSMMLYLKKDRVNMHANDDQLRGNLGVGGDIPYHEATFDEGKIRFDLQAEGLIKFAKSKLQLLLQNSKQEEES